MTRIGRSGSRPGGTWAAATVLAAGLLLGATPVPVMAVAPAGTTPSPVIVTHGPRTEKVIALTIDDGYDPAACLRMASILRARGATATWFPIGKNVRRWPAVWERIAADMPVANHTMFHAILPRLPDRLVFRQVNRARLLLERTLPEAATLELRPPGGAWTPRVAAIARSAGYRRLLLWDTTNLDTDLDASRSQRLAAALSGGRGSIVLMHCNHDWSADLLPEIIAGYRARGYRFVTLPELLGPAPRAGDGLGAGAGTRPR